jgi:SCY1-like protein 1
VRTKAFQATEVFLQAVKTYHSKLNAGDSSTVPATAVTASTTTGLLGWAVNSLAPKQRVGDHVTAPSESTSVANNTASAVEVSAPLPIAPLSNSFLHTDEAAPASPTSTDGWGDAQDNGFAHDNDDDEKDGWGDMDLPPDPVPALARIRAAQMKPVTTTTTAKITTKPGGERVRESTTKTSLDVRETIPKSSSADGWGNEDDPWAAIAAPPPSTTVRALNSSGGSAVSRATSAGSGAPRVRQAQHVTIDGAGSGRGRGRSAAPMKLGAQRIQRSAD